MQIEYEATFIQIDKDEIRERLKKACATLVYPEIVHKRIILELLKMIGCNPRSYEESRRELWELGGAKITIDDWPYLYPLVEVEAISEQEVKSISEQLGFDWNLAKFCTAGDLYVEKYGKGPLDIARELGAMTTLTFKGVNPFI